MDRYYSEIVTIGNFNINKIRQLYGILKGFKRPNTYFTIQTKNGKFKLSSCSFLILLSLIGIKEEVEISLIGNNLEELKSVKQQIRRIS